MGAFDLRGSFTAVLPAPSPFPSLRGDYGQVLWDLIVTVLCGPTILLLFEADEFLVHLLRVILVRPVFHQETDAVPEQV